MNRSGYSDDCENLGLWRGAVQNAIRGKRGQSFLREMADALDAMPVRELIAGEVVRDVGHVCAIGAVAVARKIDVAELDIHDGDAVGNAFGIARALALEIAYENDEHAADRLETPEERWRRMRAWVDAQIVAVQRA
jgi:hypothetical protein